MIACSWPVPVSVPVLFSLGINRLSKFLGTLHPDCGVLTPFDQLCIITEAFSSTSAPVMAAHARSHIRRPIVPCGRKRKLKKIATHKRKKKKRKNRHKTRK
jgi:hypothetical protein